jgi:hypothetical protein
VLVTARRARFVAPALAVAVTAAFVVTLAARSAHAHEPFSITTDARALRDGLTLHVTMAGRTATLACPSAAGPPHRLTAADLERFRSPLEGCARGLYLVTSNGRRLEPRSVTIALTEEDDFDARLAYPPAGAGPLVLDAAHLAKLPDAMYGAEITVTGERVFLGQALLRAATPSLTVEVPASGAPPSSSTPRVPTFGEYLRLGVEHILTGYDHLAFLFGLLAVCRKLTSVLAIVTAFTVAHSLTLASAALGWFTLPSRIVEPLIGATIVAVAAENLFRHSESRYRWLVAFGFGLIHGFGFAGALRAIGLGEGGAPLAIPLFAFNLGVELGQAGVVILVLPILFRLRRWATFERHGPRAISVLVGLAGLGWLASRLS